MTETELNNFRKRVDYLLSERRLGEAFAVLRNTARVLSDWHISERIEQAEQGYSYMLRYLVDGFEDPTRDELYNSLLNEASAIRDMICRQISLIDTPTLYFNTLRNIGTRSGESLSSLLQDYKHAADRLSPFEMISSGIDSVRPADRQRCESFERDIFNRLWTTFPLGVGDISSLRDFMADESVDDTVKALSVSAVTLGLLEYFDERRVDLLLDAYCLSEQTVSMRAAVGLVLAFYKYRNRPFSKTLRDRLATVKETPGWSSDIRQVFIELIRTNDTKRITSKLKDEIIPDIKKMGESLSDKTIELDLDSMSADGNPEWEKMISDEKVRNNLKELSELQMEGADVFMATFSGLKQFHFFNDVANWFLPYRTGHSAVTSNGLDKGLIDSLQSIISVMPFVCDSDKYSMMLSLGMMPEVQRAAMMKQFDMQRREMEEAAAMSETSAKKADHKAEINNYVLSIYRFYNLFRRKSEFYNPFAEVINPLESPMLADDFSDIETLTTLAEFYFKIGLYSSSRMVFERLDSMAPPEPLRYQKSGYCCERSGDYQTAARYYEQADLLDGRNRWNLRRYGAVLRRLGRIDEAIDIFKRLETVNPDDFSCVLTLGHLYIEAGRYRSAIDSLHKAEFIDEHSSKPLRPLAWALFLAGDLDGAEQYIRRVIAVENPTANDFLNAGHIAWARGRLPEAVNFYKLSLSERGGDSDELIKAIRKDRPYLEKAGINTSTMALVIDAIIYATK